MGSDVLTDLALVLHVSLPQALQAAGVGVTHRYMFSTGGARLEAQGSGRAWPLG